MVHLGCAAARVHRASLTPPMPIPRSLAVALLILSLVGLFTGPAEAASINRAAPHKMRALQHHHHHHHNMHPRFKENGLLLSRDWTESYNQTEDAGFLDDEGDDGNDAGNGDDQVVTIAAMFQGDPFSVPISTSPPPYLFPRVAHPLQPFDGGNNGKPIPTNKFYSNLMLGSRANPAYCQPYSVWQANSGGNGGTNKYWGMAVSHVDRSQFAFGPDPNAQTARYYFAPVGVMSMVFGATEFDQEGGFDFSVNNPTDMAVNAVLGQRGGNGRISMPLVLGMGMVTATYSGLTPKLMSAIGFSAGYRLPSPQGNRQKYEFTLNTGTKWLVYVTVPAGQPMPTFYFVDNGFGVEADTVGYGVVVQVAHETPYSQPAYDQTAGRFVTGATVNGNVYNAGQSGTYKIQYTADGASVSGNPLVFAAPHHVASLTPISASRVTNIQLDSPTMGLLTAYKTTSLEMEEDLPAMIGFTPYTQLGRTGQGLTPPIQALLTNTMQSELAQDFGSQTNLDSTYFSGKGLGKFAQIIGAAWFVLNNENLARAGLAKLKAAFAVFSANQQRAGALVYDVTWGGIVSTAGLSGDATADFGNSYYNDHHFHYGYFVHAAAVIARLDTDLANGDWLAQNRDFVNTLVRDVANPNAADPYFPVWRSFDWYAGHSWAKGLFESADGKDEESSSEDVHFAYGMKLWGKVSGDLAMEARGNLMLAVLKRSLNSYFLYQSTNYIMPPQILPNKVSGILFENKVDHSTYFGAELQYIQGIHMVPITSVSSYIRGPSFVAEEWNALLAPIVGGVTDGWRGILMQNLALSNPSASLEFFAGPQYSDSYLDGGMSRSWALAYAAYCV